jgi:phosphoribosylaminoimidazole-succinocarboxamide synthase
VANVSDLALTHSYTGKVRDLYEFDDQHILMVASDRLSAFDVVMNEAVPEKGRVLTGLTNFWLNELAGDVPSALVTCDPKEIDAFIPGFSNKTEWHGRTMLARRATMLPIECIVRGRLAGSAYEEYVARGTVNYMTVPTGMQLTDPFVKPLFTPSTKATTGHDLNIDLATAASIVGEDALAQAQSLCLDLFTLAAEKLASVGLVLADTKFELGFIDGEMAVCDEVLTPDSSRIWPAEDVRSGETPPAFDKQPFRDWLTTQGWNRTPPPPPVPDEVVAITSDRYVQAYERVTGHSLRDWYGS